MSLLLADPPVVAPLELPAPRRELLPLAETDVVEAEVLDTAAVDDTAAVEAEALDAAAVELPTAEDALVAAAVAGDPKAREQLLTEIRPFVVRYCRARLGARDTPAGSADDVAQEVCLAVARALPRYSITSTPFTAFVYGIAAHKVVDAFRVIGRNRCDPMADLPDSVDDCRGPEHRALAGELAAEVYDLLDVLTPRQREILVLRVAVGLSAKETAQAVGTTPEAVRVAQHRALTRLRGLARR